VKVLGEIPAAGSEELRAGTLRRRDLKALGLLLDQLAGARTLLVTGEPPRKRALAVGLAAAAAAAGTRTALLECDLTEPSLADALGLATAPGLCEYLRGEVEAGRILRPLVLAGPGAAGAVEPLVCVVAGRPANDGAGLLGSDAFRQAVAGIRDANQLVLVEGPPPHADGALASAAAVVDATLLCVGPDERARPVSGQITGLVVQGEA